MLLTLSVTFDAGLPCKGDFSVEIERWRLNVGDHSVHQNIPGLQSALKLADKDLCHTVYFVDCSSSHVCMLRTLILGLKT